MKAIKYLSVLFLFTTIIFACNTKTQAKQSLDQTTKDYFDIKDGSTYTFANVNDTNMTIVYTTSGFFNNQSNPDIENSEVMSYDLKCAGQKSITIRSETGGAQFKDRIAVVTNRNDTNYAGPVIFNTQGTFSTIQSVDSVYQYPSYTINTNVYKDVVKVVMKTNNIYKEIYFAKYLGMIAKKERDGTFLYAKKYKVNR
jgi:hypothetical protein